MENSKTTIVDNVGNFVQSGYLQLYIDSLNVDKSVDNVDNFGITWLFVVDEDRGAFFSQLGTS